MAPSPCLPTGQAETLPPLPKLKRLSTFRKKLPSQGTNQARNERCIPCVDTQSSVSGQMAPDLSTDVHGTTPSLTVPHTNHTEQVMHTKASYMQQRIFPVRSPSGYATDHISSQHASPSTQQEKQPTLIVPQRNPTEQAMHTMASYGQQRIPPVGSQDNLNFTGYFSPSGYATNHLSPQHTLPSTQQEKQQRFDSSHNVSSQHNEWRRQMQLQHSRVPHPRHRNAHHSYGHDYRSSLHIHHSNYSQHFGNAGQQAHEAGREESHQSRLPHQMHQFSRQGMQHMSQDAMQMYRQNGRGLQYHCQNQVKREENHRQYQSQMQVYKQQNQGQNQINRMQQYYAQMYQQNGQKQYDPDLQYNGRHQVQMGEEHQMSQTEKHTMIMKAYRKRSQHRDFIKDWLTQFSHSKTQQVHRTEEEKELPQQTNQQLHNHQGVGGSSEQHWQASRRLLHYKNLEKANESCSKGNANGAGSPKNNITPQDENTPPNHLNANPQSQMDPLPGKTDVNHTQLHPQTSTGITSTPSSVSENLEHTTMVGGHTLISTETFLSYLKTSAAEEDNGGNTRPPASAPHSSTRVNAKTGASVRFIDLLEDDECNDVEDAIVSPRSSSSSTDQEKEMNYCDESENIAQLGSSSSVYKQVDRNSDSENSFTDNMQREMDRETHTDVTELDGSFQPTNMLKPSESIPTLVGCESDSGPTILEYREIVTEKCKHPENNALIRPTSPVNKQGEHNAVDIQTENTQREIIEETRSALTVSDCVTPANNPATRANNEKEIGKYCEFENNTILYSSSLVHKQADRNLHTNYNLNDNSQREKDDRTQSPNISSGNVEIGIPQCGSFPSPEAPPQFNSFQNASMLDACVNDRLTPPDSDPPTPENHEKETDKCRDTEDALSRSFSHVYKRSGENTHFENNVSENTQTELSEEAPTSPEFLSDNSELGLVRGVSSHSVDATIQSGIFRTKKPPRFIVRAAPPKRDPETSGYEKYSTGYKSKAKNNCKTPEISTPPAGDCTSSAGGLTPTPEVNKLVNVLTPSTPEADNVNDSTLQAAVSTPPAITVQLNVPQYTPVLTPLTDTCVTAAYTPPSPCIPAQPTEVSITSVDANKPSIQASEPYLQVQDSPENLSNGLANNRSPSQVVHKLPIHAHKMPELVPIRHARRKKRVPEGPSPEDFVSIRNSPEEKESYHSEVYAVGVRRMDTSHHEQILQRIDFRARIQEGSDAPDRQSIGSIFHKNTSQDDCSVIEQLTLSSPNKTELENGCHIRTLDMNLTEDERPFRCTAPSAADGAESEPSHHEQIMQRNYSTNAQNAPDTSGRHEINTSYHMKSLQFSFPSNSFHFHPNAIEKNNVLTGCLMQAFNVSDSTSNQPVPRTLHKSETSHLKQEMVNSVAMFMNADLFPNAGERPKLETTVQCLTCYETVEGEDACHHMFFGQLKCEKCDEIIASCKDLQRTLSSVEMCKKNSRRPHRYTEWNIPPIDFLCYRLRKTEKDGSFLSTLEAMERYLEILSPLKNTKLWKSALKKCQAFTTMMLASSRQEGDRKKRQKNQNTTEKKQKTK
ncbi:putative mediator of RNA polymerase II transcription subunit 26 [Penaeus indicus]|uniref:putative mediator of RNA polymerase II transcription subunit 26 n=1 Tax=Penaeus indicus TaxID=29960 RepID=UPI00300D95C5